MVKPTANTQTMRIPIFLLAAAMFFLSGCMKPIPNDPVLQETFEQRPENLMIEFYTDKGRQVAYYLPPLSNPDKAPKKLVIMYPGINSIALGWLRFIKLEEDRSTGYLLIEYPNRGLSEGSMRPEKNYKNSVGALCALAEHFKLDKLPSSIRLLGHSFGTGMALQFAAIEPADIIVLVSPFSDLKEGVKQRSWFLSVIMPSQIDNRQLIRDLLAKDDPPEINILHGKLDTVLPFSMGQELAQVAPDKTSFYPFEKDDHTSILTSQRDLIFTLLLADH